MPKLRHLILSSAIISLSACGIYRLDTQQGNVLEAEKVAQISVGMPQGQVQQILGTPVLDDPFKQNRWDYVYYFREAGEDAEQQRLSIFFGPDGRVLRVEKSKT